MGTSRIAHCSRRTLIRQALGAVALPIATRVAGAQAYPARPVTVLVGFPAGSGVDVVARLVAEWLSKRLGQTFVVENWPGAGTNVATAAVVRAPADGYTLLWVNATNAVNASLYDKLDFDFIRDIAPVAGVARINIVMVVDASLPPRTLPEFIAYAKMNPGKVAMASPFVGTVPHLAAVMFKSMASLDMPHVPYASDAEALADLQAGKVQAQFSGIGAAIGLIRAGKVRALAVTTAARSPALPEVPTVGEFLPGYEASSLFGVGAPRNTPAGIVDTLSREIGAALADPQVSTRLSGSGNAPMPMSPAEFGKFIAAETEKWARAVKLAGAKAG